MNSEKQPASLETLPEDIIPSIVNFIKRWAQIKAVGVDRKKKMQTARRSRDSALSAMALSSTKGYDKWLPFLLEDVTLRSSTLASFLYLSDRLPESGRFVKTLRLEEDKEDDAITSLVQLWRSFPNLRRLPEARLKSVLLEQYLDYCINLQTFVLSSDMLSAPLVNKKGIPFRCLTSSLKRLFVTTATTKFDEMMNAQNVIWLLVFCPHLVQAVLSFSVDLASFNYLHEYVETFEGLSNVKQLSIVPAFTWNSGTRERPTWSGYRHGQRNLIGNSLETQTVHTFLRVTKNLSALEIFGKSSSSHLRGKGVVSRIHPACVGGISESCRSIKHLRLIALGFVEEIPARVFYFSPFKNLKILSIDFPRLRELDSFQADSSESVKFLHLPYYAVAPSGGSTTAYLEEDEIISTILNKSLFSNLQQVCVPSSPLDRFGEVASDLNYLRRWRKGRQELNDNNLIKSGKIKLTMWASGEVVGDASQGEACPSYFDWLGPFPL